MSKLLDYINVLDQDATAREAFAADPQAAMTQHGLNSAEQEALLSKDKTAIANLAGIDVDDCPDIQLITPTF
jgi:hypothetical protein